MGTLGRTMCMMLPKTIFFWNGECAMLGAGETYTHRTFINTDARV